MSKFLVSVIGGYECDEKTSEKARQAGSIIAEEGGVLISGGLAGVMEAASKGARKAGGTVVGFIPGEDKGRANEYVDIAIATGMGYSRNTLVAGAADMVVAFKGKYGTLSEIGFALNAKKPVYGFGTWEIPGVTALDDPEELRGIVRERMRSAGRRA
ncbi:MAG: TIGR00725 family protein [Candidatus Omnitrophica bacterium]|nr:TIGR00725 family protein [Candidatus Omnitrophota bacterium]